jgi:hypothetical protein
VGFMLALALCVWFVDRCLSFFSWPLCCPFFFDLRILITPLVSSNFSYLYVHNKDEVKWNSVCRNKTTILAFQPPQVEINKRSLWVVDGQFEGSSLILLNLGGSVYGV